MFIMRIIWRLKRFKMLLHTHNTKPLEYIRKTTASVRLATEVHIPSASEWEEIANIKSLFSQQNNTWPNWTRQAIVGLKSLDP